MSGFWTPALAQPHKEGFIAGGHFRIDLRSGLNRSWIVSILPFVEQQALYQQFDRNRHVAANRSLPQAQQPASLLCASGQAFGRMYSWRASASEDGVEATPFAKGNYAAFVNPFHVDDFYTPGPLPLYGQDLRQVSDGLSSTLALSEVRTRDNDLDQRGTWALPWSGATLLSFDAHPTWYPLNSNQREKASDDFTFSGSTLGQTQLPNGKLPDVLYDCPDLVSEQIERMPCTANTGYTSAAPRSNHIGGVNAACLDGSVHFLVDDIDEFAMAYLIGTTDGVVVDIP